MGRAIELLSMGWLAKAAIATEFTNACFEHENDAPSVSVPLPFGVV